jgi:hypothetical protein
MTILKRIDLPSHIGLYGAQITQTRDFSKTRLHQLNYVSNICVLIIYFYFSYVSSSS